MSTAASPVPSSAANRSAATACRESGPRPVDPTTCCSSWSRVWSPRTRCARGSHPTISVAAMDPEEYDKLRRRVLWTMPYGLYVLGSRAGDRRNGMTLNWATQVSFDPKLLLVSVERGSVTHELMLEGGAFALNLVDREDRAIVRKFTKPVEVDLEARTLNGFAFHDGRSGAPILDQAVGYVDC